MLSQDLTKLQTLTSRINNIYISIGERINSMTKSKEAEHKDLTNKKVSSLEESKKKNLNIKNLMKRRKNKLRKSLNLFFSLKKR